MDARFFLLLVVAFAASACAHAEGNISGAPRWPSCLGSMCFSDRLPDAKGTLARLEGSVPNRSLSNDVHCFSSDGRTLAVSVDGGIAAYVSAVELSSKPICKNGSITRERLASWATGEGLTIGAPLSKVLQLYGKPNVVELGVDTLKWEEASKHRVELDDDSVLIYGPTSSDALFQASIHIRSGSVVGIALSNAE